MELGKRMNKDIVEFIFEPKFSPLKRKTLSNEIKVVTQVKSVSKQLEQESKLEILNYLINSLSSTTNSIVNYFETHPKKSIDELLGELHKEKYNEDEDVNSGNLNGNCGMMESDYNEIPVKTQLEALNLIEENSEIRIDNYSIMFDSIKLTLDEVINPKKTNNNNNNTNKGNSNNSNSARGSRINQTEKIERKGLKELSRTFNINIDLNSNNPKVHVTTSQTTAKQNQLQLNQHHDRSAYIPYSISKNGVIASNRDNKEDGELLSMREIFKEKMINRRLKKKKNAIGSMKLKTNYTHNMSPNYYNKGNNTDRSDTVSNEFDYSQRNSSAIINLKQAHAVPLPGALPVPLGWLYKKPKKDMRNRTNANINTNTNRNTHCTVIEEEKGRNYSLHMKKKNNSCCVRKKNCSYSNASFFSFEKKK